MVLWYDGTHRVSQKKFTQSAVKIDLVQKYWFSEKAWPFFWDRGNLFLLDTRYVVILHIYKVSIGKKDQYVINDTIIKNVHCIIII